MVKVYHSESMSHHVSKFLDLTDLQRLNHLTELDAPCVWMSLYNLDDYMRCYSDDENDYVKMFSESMYY